MLYNYPTNREGVYAMSNQNPTAQSLLHSGEWPHITKKLKELALEGFSLSTELYAISTLYYFKTLRCAPGKEDSCPQVHWEEMYEAIGLVTPFQTPRTEQLIRHLRCELICWHLLALESPSTDEEATARHKTAVQTHMRIVKLYQEDNWIVDYLTFIQKHMG